MIVVDTGAMVALLDATEDQHGVMKDLYEEHRDNSNLPWAILPEVDYLVSTHLWREGAGQLFRGPRRRRVLHRMRS